MMHIIKKAVFIIVLLIITSCGLTEKSKSSQDTPLEEITSNSFKTDIDEYLEEVIQENDIPGVALGIVKNGTTVYETYIGKASLETGVEVGENTLFRIYSTTKLITVTAIFKLIEDQRIDLNDSISMYIDNLPETWKDRKIHHLISHSSGLPDMSNFSYGLTEQNLLRELNKVELEFEAGEKWSYNQTNYWFLAKIIERISSLTYEDFVFKNQFENNKNGIVFSSNHTDLIEGKAPLHWFNPESKEYERVKVDFAPRANSGSGLHLSLREFVEWNKRLDKNILLSEETKQMMWKPYVFANENDDFLYGWGTYDNNSIGFTGSGVTGYRKFLDHDLTILFLSNGFKSDPAHNEIIDTVAKIILQN